jgi:hypothetical protein
MIVDEETVLADRCTSFWLRDAIVKTKNRDVVDALSDTEILLAILNARFSDIRTGD